MIAKRVMVAPMDWGIGHATRCIPVINEFLKRDCTVYLAGNGQSLNLLRDEFPLLESLELTPYNPRYSSTTSQVMKMLGQFPKFVRTIQREHNQTEQYVREKGIDIVLSDNRFGCWSAKAISVFMTHQLNILMPPSMTWIAGMVNRINQSKIKKISRCWIPDVPGVNSLSGELSVTTNPDVRYIGWLSRFSHVFSNAPKKYDVAAILSGPEPQRGLLENILLDQFKKSNRKCILVRGKGNKSFRETMENVETVDFLNSKDLQVVIEQSDIIIARSGYSTLMDLAELNKKAIFIPTPGQTEQEYLARRLSENGTAFYMNQGEFNLNIAMERAVNYTGFKNVQSMENRLMKAIDEILL